MSGENWCACEEGGYIAQGMGERMTRLDQTACPTWQTAVGAGDDSAD